MKRNDTRAAVTVLALLVAAAALIAFTRAPLVESGRAVHRDHDTYWLPRTRLAIAMSLGYRSAFADFLFAHVLVAYGQHFQEKRRFEHAADYLDAITTLDPKFREPYRVADTLIVLGPTPARIEDYRAARRIGERGVREFPYDSEIWLVVGQYLAYLAARYVPPEEHAEWRLAGARMLERSCELVGSNENIPHHCITAAALFNETGNRAAMRSFLERVLSVSDDPEIQELAGGYLGHVLGDAEREHAEERGRRFKALWSRDLTFVSRDALLLLGPRFEPAHCAGAHRADDTSCFTSFRAWGEYWDSQ